MIATPPPIHIIGDELSITFDRFDAASYSVFLKAKALPESTVHTDHDTLTHTITAPARFAGQLGVTDTRTLPPGLVYSDFLFDDQAAIAKMAFEAKRFAVWLDCGLGKTPVTLEFARHVLHATGGRFLIFTFKNIIDQWLDEAKKFYGATLPIVALDSREAVKEWCKGQGPDAGVMLAVTNYEKLNHEGPHDQQLKELRLLSGIAADESSRLKTGGGKQKWALIKSSKGIPYKLSCTATPAPNDYMEFASQAAFLEKMRDGNEVIWTFFRRDKKTKEWTIRKHARTAFFEFLAGWSIYVRDPRLYGWRKNVGTVPEPQVFEYKIATTEPQRDWLADLHQDDDGNGFLFASEKSNTIQRAKLGQIAKGFVYSKGKQRVVPVDSLKPAFVADLIVKEMLAGHQVLVWTTFTAESAILAQLLKDRGYGAPAIEVLNGKVTKGDRAPMLERFRRGESRVLISLASMVGWGMNFQFCTSMIFSGFTDSYEAYYQSWRRAVRYGQTQSVRIHIPYIPELEGEALENIRRKQFQHEAAIREMQRNYINVRQRRAA